MALQLRRGTNAQRLAVTPLEGELVVVMDYAAAGVNPLWLGDGATVGGVVPITLELDDLTDVVIAELVDKQILQYNSLTQQWNNVSNPVLTGLTAGNITVGLTDNNAITTTTGNLTINAAGGTTTIDDNLIVTGDVAVNGGDVTTTSGTGNLFNANATTVNIGNGATTEVNLGAAGSGRVQIKSPQLDVNGNATVTGNLTVNGTTTTINTDTLDVEDKNITLAKVITPSDAIANGGGITLKGTTDKTINWYDADDRWYFNNGDGVERPFVVTLNDLSNVQTTAFSAGELLVAKDVGGGNIEFVNTSLMEFTSLAARPKFINAATGGTVGAEFLRRVSTAADGDISGVFFGTIDSANNKLLTQRIISEYDTAGSNILRVQSDAVGNFGAGTTTIKTQLALNDTELLLNPTNLKLNANHTGAPSANATIAVERGSSTDAELGWIESTGFWSFNQPVFVQGGLIGADFIATNGLNIFFNNEDATPGVDDDASITVKRGSGADVSFRWNEGDDRWESTTNGSTYVALPNQALDTGSNPAFAGLTAGNIAVGTAGDNEIDTITGNLTLDSAGGTVIVDDNLTVNSNLVVFGTTTLGDAAADAVNINSGTINLGTTAIDAAITLGNASTDTVTVNATSTFNTGVAVKNLRIATATDNTISSSTGAITLAPASSQTNVTGALAVSTDLTVTGDVTADEVFTRKVNISDNGVTIEHANLNSTGTRLFSTSVITTTSTTPTAIDLDFISQEFASVDFTVLARKGNEWQVVKGMILIDGVNNDTFLNIYSDLRTGSSDLFSVTANITVSNNVQLLVTSSSATSTKYSANYIAQYTPI